MKHSLQQHIKKAVDCYYEEPSHHSAVTKALSRPGFPLHPDAHCRAGVLTLNVAETLSGCLDDVAFQSAAAVELHMAAAYMFDHVADHEVDPKHGFRPEEELALAISVLSCGGAVAAQAIEQARENRHRQNMPLTLKQFHTNFINACAGQYLDAHLEKDDHATSDDALKMTSLKAGSLGKMAAALGASVVTDNQDIIEACGEFGFNLFTYAQLLDDIRDACPFKGPKRDLSQGKCTVPLVFFYNSVKNNQTSPDFSWQQPDEDKEIVAKFERSGAALFAAVVAETFLNGGKRSLDELKKRGIAVDKLQDMVNSVEISPETAYALG